MVNQTINFHFLNSHSDYTIHQRHTVRENDRLVSDEESISSISLRIISLALSRAASLEVHIGDITYVKGESPEPFFLKKFTNQLSNVLSDLILRVDENANIVSINNIEQIEAKWKGVRNNLFDNGKNLSKDEKKKLQNKVDELLNAPQDLANLIKKAEPFKYLFAEFYNQPLILNQEYALEDKVLESNVLYGFSLNMNYCAYLEFIDKDQKECGISVYGLMDTKQIDYTLLENLFRDSFGLELEAYNYFVDIYYIVDIETGLIKNMEGVVEESFNDSIEYKIYYDIDKVSL